MSVAHHTQVCVIGAGVIGLATARALAMAGKEVVILEREPMIGSGISSRNSEVVHAGIYYPPNSLKAHLCLSGRNALYSYCAHRNIPHSRTGKLIVATTHTQLTHDLPLLLQRAQTNGVSDLQRLTPDDVASPSFEPTLTCHGALFSPSTGVVDSHGLMVALACDAEEAGAVLALRSPVQGVRVGVGEEGRGRMTIEVEGMELSCDVLVNCAGLHAGKVAEWIGDSGSGVGGAEWGRRRHFYAKGNYYRLEGQRAPFRHLVYPMPEPGGLGVHATIDLGGNTRCEYHSLSHSSQLQLYYR